MKDIFIGWSGDTSKEVANILKQWIPTVFLQENKPFVSFQDIAKGANWNYELNKVLKNTHFGILCFTKDNLDSIWLHFEAGVLLKQFDNTKVCPLFYKVENKLEGPLSQFQGTKFEERDICQLIHSINNSCMDPKLDEATLNTQFIRCWPELEEKLKNLEKSFPTDLKNISIDIDDKILSSLKVQTEALYEISERINKISFDYPNMLDKFMDDTGVTYRSSIFGTRINHFSNEKKALARKTIEILQKKLTDNKEKKICLLIDSGTTTYDLFCEISDMINAASGDNKSKENDLVLDIWHNRIFIITNNLPGIQYLMKKCRMGNDDYSDLSIKCLLLPGKPLPVYAAVAGSETIDFIKEDKIRKLIEEELNVKNREEYEIVGIMSGNYIVRHGDKMKDRELFCPVARGGGEVGGHYDIKNKFAVLSDKIYLISPLTKISFATCECLNKINGYTIDEGDPKAKDSPDKVKYREIQLTTEEMIKKCNYILTERKYPDIFKTFSRDLQRELENTYSSSNIHFAHYDIKDVINDISNDPSKYIDLELEIEIPHGNLRNAYLENKKKYDDQFIWSHSWISTPANKCGNNQNI